MFQDAPSNTLKPKGEQPKPFRLRAVLLDFGFAGSRCARDHAGGRCPYPRAPKGSVWPSMPSFVTTIQRQPALRAPAPSEVNFHLSVSSKSLLKPTRQTLNAERAAPGTGRRQPAIGVACSKQRSLEVAAASTLLTCASCCHPERSPRTRTCT